MVNLGTVYPRKEQNSAQLIVTMMLGAKIAPQGFKELGGIAPVITQTLMDNTWKESMRVLEMELIGIIGRDIIIH